MQLPVVAEPLARIPALHARWVEQVLGAIPPAEPLATCDDCAQLPRPGEPLGPEHYNPLTKCCTYLPVLHNYQVGALLDDPEVSAAGRATVEARIAEGRGVTPVGLVGYGAYYHRYSDRRFGRDEGLLCPHYLEGAGSCGIWQHRNATCTTWFCRFSRGKASFELWRRGLMAMLRSAEETVSEWVVFALGAEENDWGPWADRRGFYRAAARMVAGYGWDKVEALGGSKVRLLADHARAAWAAFQEAPPDPAWMPGQATGSAPEVSRLSSAPGEGGEQSEGGDDT